MTYRILDLFCGAGGAAEGYRRAGFEVVGVDNKEQPRYPFDFCEADALWFLVVVNRAVRSKFRPDVDAIHASPPCQRYSKMTKSRPGLAETKPDLLGPTRELLEQTGLPYVIENVPAAPMRIDFRLCGCQFGLGVRRERWFETNWHTGSDKIEHDHSGPAITVAGNGGSHSHMRNKRGMYVPLNETRQAMDIDWMTARELSQAIPPAYTEYIGTHLHHYLDSTSNQEAA